jgi:hypothetical protein
MPVVEIAPKETVPVNAREMPLEALARPQYRRSTPALIGCSWDGSEICFNAFGHIGGKKAPGEHLDLATKKRLKLKFDAREVVQRGTRRGLDENVQIAFLSIVSPGRRAEYPRGRELPVRC